MSITITEKFRKIYVLSILLTFVCIFGLRAQTAVTGTVTDESGETVIGANIQIKGSDAGTITDVNGKYSIQVPNSKAVLVFSFIGYGTQEKTVGNHTVIDVVLKEDGVMLNEVVAIGYATVKKGDLTGSVSKVNMDNLNKAPIVSFDQALGGQVAGVQVVSGDGRPGAEANIVIRGSNTISDNADGSPLYVIDGFATDSPNTAAYNPNDIESIDILKDASATAIYGARGANGVIIITTKRGVESAPRISYDGYVSWQLSPQYLHIMQGKSFVALQQEVLGKEEMEKTYYGYSEELGRNRTLKDYDYIPSYNWQKEVFRGAPMTSHHLSLSGGSKNTRYSSSISYYRQEGVIIHSSYESLKARLTLDQQITNNLKFGATLNFANNVSVGSAPSQAGGGTAQYFLYQVLAYRPLGYNETDDLMENTANEDTTYPYNPLKTIQNQVDRTKSRQLNLNTYLTWNINRNLTFKGTFSYSWRTDKRQQFNNSNTYLGDPRYSANRVNGAFSIREWDNWSNEYTLTYNRRAGDHNLTAQGGASLSSQSIDVLGAQAVHIPWEQTGFWGMDSGTPKSITASRVENNLMSYFVRANYDWRSRYLLSAIMRADGSSRFPYNKWGYFPSASFAWRISDEPFMKLQHSFLSNLKLRIGWGITGNNNTYNNYPSSRLYDTDNKYAFNNALSPAVYVSQTANRNLKWETTYQTNLGIDFGMFNNRINGEVDIYNKDTKDLLLYAEVPASLGFSSVQQNIGSINNRGVEFTVNTVNLPGGKGRLKWTTNFNISFNKNKITALSDGQESRLVSFASPSVTNPYICKVGHPLSEMYGYVYEGVYQYEDFDEVSPNVFVLKPHIPNNTQERSNIRPGDVKLRDINGDGQVTSEDQTIIGHGLPLHTGGFTNNFEWKNFDLSIFFQWSYGNDVINYNRVKLESLRGKHVNQLSSAANHWTPRTDNGDGTYTDGNYTNYLCAVNRSLANVNTSREVEDASFLRLKTVQVGYNFPTKTLRNLKIRSMRLYLTAQNLFTLTRYTGYDPEVSTRNSAMTRGFDYSSYPKTTSFTFGVRIGL